MDWIRALSSDRPGKKYNRGAAYPPVRTAFEQDFDRIIFSSPFRMLQDKTQVFPLPKHDFVHTRLTHSLEVSSVGRSLGKKTGEVIIERNTEISKQNITAHDISAIIASACLTHDLGNPPFGHSGEKAISEFFLYNENGTFFKDEVKDKEWKDLVNFEGNAQGFRLLNKEKYQGLRLTYATLAAFSKYPRESLISSQDSTRRSQKKYGFYQSEKEIFREIANETGLTSLSEDDYVWTRHPLAFLVEAADDICYHIIDLEDGCNAGLVSFDETKDLMGAILGDQFQPQKLSNYTSIREKVGLLRALAIGVLIEQATAVFLDHEKEIIEGKFDKAITELLPSSEILKQIIQLSVNRIYQSEEVLDIEVAGFEVINGLLETFTSAAYHLNTKTSVTSRDKAIGRILPEEIQTGVVEKQFNTYDLLRNILDHISGMTDSHAINLYRKINGIAMPGI